MKTTALSLLLGALSLIVPSAFAAQAAMEFGMLYHSGPDIGSMSKKLGYLLGFKAQSSGSIRYELGGQAEMVSGTVSFASATADVRVIKALGTGAVSVNPFYKFKMSPFFGVQGLGGFAAFESAVPPGTEPLSRTGYIYGYEAFVGTDYGIGNEKNLRFKIALRKMSTTYNSATLDLGGLVGYISYVFPAEN